LVKIWLLEIEIMTDLPSSEFQPVSRDINCIPP